MLARRSRRALRLGPVVALALTAAAGCSVVDALDQTAYCRPGDPVVAPLRVAPGDELEVDVPGREDGVDCEPRLPDRARYGVSIMSEKRSDDPDEGHVSAALGMLDPNSDGDARGTVRVPDDFPAGDAEVLVRLQYAKTLCEIDPSMSCAKNPFATIEVTG